MNKSNLGCFTVSARTFEKDLDQLVQIFSLLKIIPLRVRYDPRRHLYEYMAIGERFEEVPDSEVVPEYTFDITVDSVKNVELVVVKKVNLLRSSRIEEFVL